MIADEEDDDENSIILFLLPSRPSPDLLPLLRSAPVKEFAS